MLLLAAFTIVLVAAAVQAATGFGFALVSVPLLALAIDPRTAVVASAVAVLAMTITWRHANAATPSGVPPAYCWRPRCWGCRSGYWCCGSRRSGCSPR